MLTCLTWWHRGFLYSFDWLGIKVFKAIVPIDMAGVICAQFTCGEYFSYLHKWSLLDNYKTELFVMAKLMNWRTFNFAFFWRYHRELLPV